MMLFLFLDVVGNRLSRIVTLMYNSTELCCCHAPSALGGYFASFPRAPPGSALGCLEMQLRC